jgi:hypothetical protein
MGTKTPVMVGYDNFIISTTVLNTIRSKTITFDKKKTAKRIGRIVSMMLKIRSVAEKSCLYHLHLLRR